MASSEPLRLLRLGNGWPVWSSDRVWVSYAQIDQKFLAGTSAGRRRRYRYDPSLNIFVDASGLPSTRNPRRMIQLLYDDDVATK